MDAKTQGRLRTLEELCAVLKAAIVEAGQRIAVLESLVGSSESEDVASDGADSKRGGTNAGREA